MNTMISYTIIYYLLRSILFIYLGLNALLAQSAAIQGIIVESQTKEPLPNANIFLDNTDYGSVSNHNGFFAINQIPVGRYTFIVKHIGYRKYQKTFELKPNESLTLEIGLEKQLIPMDSVIVSATLDQPVFKNSRHYLTSSQIRVAPAIGEPDLIRTIQNLPGITTTNDYNLGFFVRGGNRDQNLILLDNIQIFNPFHLLGIFSTFDTDAIQGAEMIKSGIDPVYGNHLSSVLDVKLRDGKADKRTLAINVSLLSAKVRIEGPQPWGSYMFTIRRTYLDLILDLFRSVNILPDEIVLPYNFVDGIGKVVFKTSPRSRIQITSYWGNDTYDLTKLDMEDTQNKLTWGNRALGISFDRQLSPKYLFHSSVTYSEFYSKWLPTDTLSVIRINNRISYNQLKAYMQRSTSSLGKIRFGVELKPYSFYFRIKGLSYTSLRMDDISTGEYSVFGSASQLLSNKFRITLGNRMTYFSYHGKTTYSPQMALIILVSPQLTFTLNWGRYHQGIMTIGNEEVILTMFEAWLPTPKNLGIMSSEHSVVSIRWRNANGLDISVETYHKSFSDLIEYNMKKYSAEEPDFVRGSGLSRGLELLLRKSSGRILTLVSYTLSSSEKTIQDITYNPRFDRTHDLNLLFQVRISRKWQMGTRFVYQTGSPFTRIIGYYSQNLPPYDNENVYSELDEIPIYGSRNSFRFPDYHRLDLNFIRSFTYKGRAMEFYIDLINIYGRLNVLRYNEENDVEIQIPPLLTFGLRTKI